MVELSEIRQIIIIKLSNAY